MYSEPEIETIRWALDRIKQCENELDVYRLFHELRERGIRFKCVGTILRQKLVEFGVESFNSGFMDVEEYFGFKTWFDYRAERVERINNTCDPE